MSVIYVCFPSFTVGCGALRGVRVGVLHYTGCDTPATRRQRASCSAKPPSHQIGDRAGRNSRRRRCGVRGIVWARLLTKVPPHQGASSPSGLLPKASPRPPLHKFRMQFPDGANRRKLKNRVISTIRFQYLKYSQGNCMRNRWTPWESSPTARPSSAWSEPSSPNKTTNGPKADATSASTSSPNHDSHPNPPNRRNPHSNSAHNPPRRTQNDYTTPQDLTVIPSGPHSATARKPRNFNDPISIFETSSEELRAKLLCPWDGRAGRAPPPGGRRVACGAWSDNASTRRAKLAAWTASGQATRRPEIRRATSRHCTSG